MQKMILSFLFCVLAAVSMSAQTTAFSYQGSLLDGANPANGNYDLEFKLFDALSGGNQQGATLQRLNIAVASGNFIVSLDFGAGTLPGADRYLDIAVRTAGGGAFTPLSPRQRVNSTPYSVKSLNATTADSVAAGGIPSGSGNYIQNGTSLQASSNFNVSGIGRAGTFRSSTFDAIGEYQSFGTRVLKVTGDNTALGPNAGDSSFGTFNTYMGSGAGTSANSNAAQNTFAGTNSGNHTTIGTRNSFFGARSGILNDNGSSNTFVGEGAGVFTISGSENSFLGADSGQSNSSGSRNSYFGVWAGGLPTVNNSSAFGYRAFATQSNSLILGSINGVNGATTDTNVGIGTTAPSQRLHVVGNGLFTGDLTVNGTMSAALPAGSANYIQNSTTAQAASNFNVSGDGTVGGTLGGNVVNATSQYNLGGSRILSNSGNTNLFAGTGSGQANSTGSNNSFFGGSSGFANTSGSGNSFFGALAGNANTIGISNSFFGTFAGLSNTTASGSSFFGRSAGFANTIGTRNSFFGNSAGLNTTSGFDNTFVGAAAGDSNTTGNSNTLIGTDSDLTNGLTNATAVGSKSYVTQNNSLVLGSINGVNGAITDTNVGIGTTAPTFKLNIVDPSNTGLRVQTNATGGTVASFGGNGAFQVDAPGIAGGRFSVLENGNVGIGTTTPQERLHVSGNGLFQGNLTATQYSIGANRILSVAGTNNLFVGVGAGSANTGGDSNAFFGTNAGLSNTTGDGNSFFGYQAGQSNTAGFNTFVGRRAGFSNTNAVDNAFFGNSAGESNTGGGNTFIGAAAGSNNTTGDVNVFVGYAAGLTNSTGSNNTVLGNQANVSLNNFSFATALGAGAQVTASNRVQLGRNGSDTVSIGALTTGGTTQVCVNALVLSTCSSSLRYKTNISPLSLGLSFVNKLSPISFDWKDGGMKDVGFGAEDIARIDPRFVTYNDKGEVEGVKYDRLSTVFVNAIKEQQAQIEAQAKEIVEQRDINLRLQKQVDLLTKSICRTNPSDEVCKEEK